ncbi:MAG: CrcB family protein [Planctomycetota bacterium]
MTSPAEISAPGTTSWPVLLLAVAVAGGLGTLARFGLAMAVGRCFSRSETTTATGPLHGFLGGVPGASPVGTLAVNALGCLMFGLVWGWTAHRDNVAGWATPELRLIVLTGFLGAFTTFSTFAFETTHLLRHGQTGAALLNVLIQNVVGLTFAFGGFALASRLFVAE